MDPEAELYGLACQDMPVGGAEVRAAMEAYWKYILEMTMYSELIEHHRPVVRRTPMTVNPLMRDAQCPACDGNRWRSVLVGSDEIPECKYWIRAKELGLVQESHSDA